MKLIAVQYVVIYSNKKNEIDAIFSLHVLLFEASVLHDLIRILFSLYQTNPPTPFSLFFCLAFLVVPLTSTTDFSPSMCFFFFIQTIMNRPLKITDLVFSSYDNV